MARPTFNPKRVLLVHAHPDDESLFTGHVIAERIAAGAEVMVFTLTRGERGKMKLQELKPLEGDLRAMGAFRSTELLNALAALGTESNPVKHAFAGTRAYLDSGMRINSRGKPAKKRRLDEMSLVAASVSVIADDIEQLMLKFQPDAVITYNSKGGFGHPDHKRAYEATAMALRHYAHNKRVASGAPKHPDFWVIAEPGERSTLKIGNAQTSVIKRSALEAHASQVSSSAETYSLAPGQELRYDTPERLRKTRPSKWLMMKPYLRSIWGLPLGIAVALVGTVLHQISTSTNDHAPIGLVLGLSMLTSVTLALRLLRNSRGALYLMAFGFLVTLFALAQKQPGNEVLIPSNLIGNYWAYGSAVIVAIIVLFPRLRRTTWNQSASGHR